jgi:hypothetical protein
MQIKKYNTVHRLKNKNNMFISMNTEKAFDKIRHVFIVKALNKLRIEGIYLSIMTAI